MPPNVGPANPVYLMDSDGNIIGAANPLPTTATLTGTITNVGIKRVDEVRINPSTEETLQAILTELGQKLEPGQAVTFAAGSVVALDVATLAALETIQIGSLPAVALDAATLAALENISVIGTVALDAPTLAALESITVSGSVGVTNFPATYPIPVAQVADLKIVSATVTNPTANPETGLAKEVTLEAVRVQTAAINANTDTLEALLTTLRDTVQRRTDPIAGGTAFLGYMGSYEDDASKQGRYRFAGGKATTSVAAPNASITLNNPTGSLVDLIVTRYQVEVDASADVVIIQNAVSTGTIMNSFNPNQRTAIANPGAVRVGNGVITGGTTASIIRRATANAPVAVGPFRFRIIPGMSFTVNFLGPGATNTVWFNMGWFVVLEGADLA